MKVPGNQGFSLVELLVALGGLAILMVGLVCLGANSLQCSRRVQEGLRAQRDLRLAMVGTCAGLRMMGYRYPPPELSPQGQMPPDSWACRIASAQPVLKWAGTALAPLEAIEDPGEPAPLRADELCFRMDLPLPVMAQLAAELPAVAAVPGLALNGAVGWAPEQPLATAIPLRVDRPVSLRPGDLLVLEDAHLEWVEVVAGVRVAAKGTTAVSVQRPGGGDPPPLAFAHAAGTKVACIRPSQWVRYAVVYLPVAGPGLEPCLLRFETDPPAAGGEPAWAGLLARPPTLMGKVRVVAERVTGFQVATDLGTGAVPGSPLGLRGIPPLLKVRLETRSPVARAEYAPPGQAGQLRFLHQSLERVVSPVNAGVGGAP